MKITARAESATARLDPDERFVVDIERRDAATAMIDRVTVVTDFDNAGPILRWKVSGVKVNKDGRPGSRPYFPYGSTPIETIPDGIRRPLLDALLQAAEENTAHVRALREATWDLLPPRSHRYGDVTLA